LAQTQKPDIDALLKQEQEALTSRKTELESELADITGRLARIERYFTDEPVERQPPTPRRTRAPQSPRGEVQTKVRELILSSQGITTADINKQLEGIPPTSIQNALGALKRQNIIVKSRERGGPWRPVQAPTISTEAPT